MGGWEKKMLYSAGHSCISVTSHNTLSFSHQQSSINESVLSTKKERPTGMTFLSAAIHTGSSARWDSYLNLFLNCSFFAISFLITCHSKAVN